MEASPPTRTTPQSLRPLVYGAALAVMGTSHFTRPSGGSTRRAEADHDEAGSPAAAKPGRPRRRLDGGRRSRS